MIFVVVVVGDLFSEGGAGNGCGTCGVNEKDGDEEEDFGSRYSNQSSQREEFSQNISSFSRVLDSSENDVFECRVNVIKRKSIRPS